MSDAGHWDAVYGRREERALTWFEADPARSVALVAKHAQPGDAVIDIGGGQSRLVDRLLAKGYGPLTVLDLSQAALEASRARLGAKAKAVAWVQADITTWRPKPAFRVWHDRAVFHFLTTAPDRAAYVKAMTTGLLPGGVAILSTFAEDGPERCSDLPVCRYAPGELAETIEHLAPASFTPVCSERHVHLTPKGAEQRFQTSVFLRTR